MNYDFLNNLDESGLQKFLWWARDFLMHSRKDNWLVDMQPVVKKGREKAEALLAQLSN